MKLTKDQLQKKIGEITELHATAIKSVDKLASICVTIETLIDILTQPMLDDNPSESVANNV